MTKIRMKTGQHFKTITYHKWLVMKGCFQIGLYWQGITHDLSKYSPTEFLTGVRYFQGDRSPNDAERRDKGYSGAWLHHKGCNRHHYEYWIDYSLKCAPGVMMPVKMPRRYIAEMFIDRVAACKVYQKDAYTVASPLAYYEQAKERMPLHPFTKKWLEKLLIMLSEEGEEKTCAYIKNVFLGAPKKKKRI